MSEADVKRIIDRDFGNDQAIDALSALGHFDTSPRIRLAILKLANGDFEKLQEAGRAAVEDYRDVLAWAEYPRYMDEIGFDDSSEAKERAIIESDYKQYQEWLQRI